MFILVDLLVAYSNRQFSSNHLKLAYEKALANIRGGSDGRSRQHQVKLGAAEIEVMIGKYREGATLRSLGALFKVHRVTVASLLQRHGINLRRQGLDPDQSAQACRLYMDGWSLARIGEKFGVSAGTVRHELELADIQRRDSHGRYRR